MQTRKQVLFVLFQIRSETSFFLFNPSQMNKAASVQFLREFI